MLRAFPRYHLIGRPTRELFFCSSLSSILLTDVMRRVRSVKVEPVDATSGERNTGTESPHSVPGAQKSHKTEAVSASSLSSSNATKSAHPKSPSHSPQPFLRLMSGRTVTFMADTPPPLSFPDRRHPNLTEDERCTDNPTRAQRVASSVRPRLTTARSPSVSPSRKPGRTSDLPSAIKVRKQQTDDDSPLPLITALANSNDLEYYELSEGEDEKEDFEDLDELSPSETEDAPEPEPKPIMIIIKRKRKLNELQQDTPMQDRKRRKPIQDAASHKRYRCIVEGCGKTFSREKDLKRHQRRSCIHRSDWVGLSCHICPSMATFSRPDALKRHKRSAKHRRNERLACLDSVDVN